MEQRDKAELLRRLHSGPDILILPNAWDAVTARIVEAEGFPAVATTSAGCAAVLGYADGQHIPPEEMLFLVGRIARSVEVPVTADVEAGYGSAVETALGVIASGAVGINLEDMAGDTLLPLERQIETIRAVRAASGQRGVPLVINARTDIFLAGHGDEKTRFARTVDRLNAYRDAGADCLFAPGVSDAVMIGELARAVRGPLNILAGANSPSIADMKRLGVARVSLGSGTSRIALGALRRCVRELRDQGTYSALKADAIPYAEIQSMMNGTP